VSGGSGGPIDERLARDVFAHKPTVVTVMLGMNDGSYRPTTDEIQDAYTKGYEHLLESIHANAPAARITLLGPSPFDEVTRPADFAGGYNAVMLHFGQLDQELARKNGALYINLNPPVVDALGKAQALNPEVAKLILPDRVHPEALAHWVMAETLLKGWNAPSLVSSVTIDALAGKVADAQNATVETVVRDKDALHWTETEKSLPLAFNRRNEFDALLLDLTDIEQQLNLEPLLVTGLAAGQYKLAIDDKPVGTFSAAELTKGINLADFDTPMRAQSQRVSWIVSDQVRAHYVHMQMQIKKMDEGDRQGKPDSMDAFENFLEDALYSEATPKAHVFSLSPAVAQP
jgi:lysophospholipase L1-like esterase